MGLTVDTKQLSSYGNSTIQDAGTFKQSIKELESETSEIKNSWLGDDSKVYIQAIEQSIESMKELGKTIEEMGQFLIEAAKTYDGVAQNTINKIHL